MPNRLRNAIALLTLFAGIAAASAWSLDVHALDTSALGRSITDAFPTAEAGFARQRMAAEG